MMPRRALILAFKIVATGIALLLIARTIAFDTVVKAFAHLQWPWALAACLSLGLEYLIASWKTGWMARAGSVLDQLRFNAMKTFVNQILPGGMGGEAARLLYLARLTGSAGRAAAVLLIDRWAGLCTQGFWSGFSLIGLTALPSSAYPREGFAIGVAAIGVSLIGWFSGPRLMAWAAKALPLARRIGPLKTLGHSIALESDAFTREMVAWSRPNQRGLELFAICSCNQVSTVLLLVTAAAALGQAIDPWVASPILLLGSLSALVPATLGSIGVQEAFFAFGYHLAGRSASEGVGVSLMLRVVQLFPTAWGAYLFWTGFKVPRVESAADSRTTRK